MNIPLHLRIPPTFFQLFTPCMRLSYPSTHFLFPLPIVSNSLYAWEHLWNTVTHVDSHCNWLSHCVLDQPKHFNLTIAKMANNYVNWLNRQVVAISKPFFQPTPFAQSYSYLFLYLPPHLLNGILIKTILIKTICRRGRTLNHMNWRLIKWTD